MLKYHVISSSFGSYKHRQKKNKKNHPFMTQPLIYWKRFNGEKGSRSMLIKYSLAFLANKMKLTRLVKIWVYEPIFNISFNIKFFLVFLHQYFVNKIFFVFQEVYLNLSYNFTVALFGLKQKSEFWMPIFKARILHFEDWQFS